MAGRGARRWREWLSDGPGQAGTAPAPGPIKIRYRAMIAWIRRHGPAVADSALAVALALGIVPQFIYWASHPGTGSFSGLVFFSALLVVPLIWRRRFPLSAFAFAALVALAQWIAGLQAAADVTLLVYLYTVASRYPLRVGVLAAAVAEVGTLLAAISWPLTRLWIDAFLLLSGPALASLLLGVSVRYWRNSLGALTERAEQLERERDQQARIATAAERTRIAREMHDVVAHSLSVMVTLSEGAVLKQAAEPERASTAMRQVSATGHQALDEMRRLLGVLRTEDAPQLQSRQPQPGLAQLDGLFEQVRATGLVAELTVTGLPAAMPPGAELAVYRIVQEALTNTLKHAAAPTRVRVTIGYQPDSVTVDVRDDGGRRAWPAAEQGAGTGTGTEIRSGTGTAGHGLTGMRERAAVYGGSVSAGPAPVGGWHIHARLPLTTSAPATAGAPATAAGQT